MQEKNLKLSYRCLNFWINYVFFKIWTKNQWKKKKCIVFSLLVYMYMYIRFIATRCWTRIKVQNSWEWSYLIAWSIETGTQTPVRCSESTLIHWAYRETGQHTQTSVNIILCCLTNASPMFPCRDESQLKPPISSTNYNIYSNIKRFKILRTRNKIKKKSTVFLKDVNHFYWPSRSLAVSLPKKHL